MKHTKKERATGCLPNGQLVLFFWLKTFSSLLLLENNHQKERKRKLLALVPPLKINLSPSFFMSLLSSLFHNQGPNQETQLFFFLLYLLSSQLITKTQSFHSSLFTEAVANSLTFLTWHFIAILEWGKCSSSGETPWQHRCIGKESVLVGMELRLVWQLEERWQLKVDVRELP